MVICLEKRFQYSRDEPTPSTLDVSQVARGANVASQPQLSPFRYPGGKTWLIPQIRRWLDEERTPILVEPFAGGATASLLAVMDGYVERAILIEKDPRVAAVWKTILSNQVHWLVDRILTFRVTRKAVSAELARNSRSTRELAFQTLLLNRMRRGGLLGSRASLLRRGERGRGLHSRWYPETIAYRVVQIHSFRGAIEIHEGDGVATIRRAVAKKWKAKFFVDPPYADSETSDYRRLYRHGLIDHWELFVVLARSKRDFLMTYASSPYIDTLRWSHGMRATPIEMISGNGRSRVELLIRPGVS